MPMAYYNENDPKIAAWLRELIKAGLIAPGDVDERSIEDVRGTDLAGYVQCHLFAGIGGWSYALRLAGWPDDRPVWTGSSPCQPFSAAGKRKGTADERHLWPHMHRLIAECKPAIVFGEQVASAAVIGKNIAANKNVQGMLDAQAVVRVLSKLGGALQDQLQALRQCEAAIWEEGSISTKTGNGSRENPGGSGEIPSSQNEPPIRSGRQRNPATNRSRALRIDGHPIRPDGTQGMEHPIFRSDHAGSGLHENEREGSPLFSQCDGPYMGAKQNHRNGGSHKAAEDFPLGRLVRGYSEAIDEPPTDWLTGIRNDLEATGYTFGACVLAASSVNAPHIRQRLFWLADSKHQPAGAGIAGIQGQAQERRDRLAVGSATCGLADANGGQSGNGHLQPSGEHGQQPQDGGAGGLEHPAGDGRDEWRAESDGRGIAGGCGDGWQRVRFADECKPCPCGCDESWCDQCQQHFFECDCIGPTEDEVEYIEREGVLYGRRLVHPIQPGLEGHAGHGDGGSEPGRDNAQAAGSTAPAGGDGFWSDYILIPCADGKARRLKPGIEPLAHGISGRMAVVRTRQQAGIEIQETHWYSRLAALHGFGNAIVPQVAAEFIKAFDEMKGGK